MSGLGDAIRARLEPAPEHPGRAAPAKAEPLGQAHGNEWHVVVRGERRYLVGPDGTEKFAGMRPRGRK